MWFNVSGLDFLLQSGMVATEISTRILLRFRSDLQKVDNLAAREAKYPHGTWVYLAS